MDDLYANRMLHHLNNQDTVSKVEKRLRIMRSLKKRLLQLRSLGLTLRDYCVEDCLSKKPYKRPLSKDLFKSIKLGDYLGSRRLIVEDRFLIYSVDYVSFSDLVT